MILYPRNLSWNNLKIVKPLKDHFDCPVILEHDATAGGIAEARIGAAQKHRVVLYVSLSTGIGSSIIFDGSPLPTDHNQEGGWQIIGSDPVLDRFGLSIGGKAIQQRFGKIAQDIHDPHIWQIIAQEFSIGIFNMITIVNPDCVVLGGGVSVHYRRFIKPLKKQLLSLGSIYPLPGIVKARYTQTAPSLGVMFLAIEELK
jgi:predicted NBD/HSP70 family sugar kinase